MLSFTKDVLFIYVYSSLFYKIQGHSFRDMNPRFFLFINFFFDNENL